MKHPDETEAAYNWMLDRTKELILTGLSIDESSKQAVDMWEKSLLRAQLVNRWQKDLLGRGKPTLHVPLFEAARMKAKR